MPHYVWGANSNPQSPRNYENGLGKLLQLAAQNNLKIEQARMQWEAKEYDPKIAWSDFLPSVSINASRRYEKIKGYYDAIGNQSGDQSIGAQPQSFISREDDQWRNQLTLTIEEEIDLLGRQAREVNRKYDELKSSYYQYLYAQSSVFNDITQTYVRVLQKKVQKDLAEQKKIRAQHLLTVLEEKYKVGLTSQYEVADAAHQKAISDTEIIEAEIELETLVSELILKVFGKDQGEPDQLNAINQSLPPGIEIGEKQAIIDSNWQQNVKSIANKRQSGLSQPYREDLKQRHYANDAFQSQLREVNYNFLPTLSLFAQYDRNYFRLANKDDPKAPDVTQSYGIALRWNLFDGGKDFFTLRKNSKLSQQNSIEYAELSHSANLQVEKQLTIIRYHNKLLDAAKAQFEKAKIKLNSATEEHKLGKISTDQLLTAQIDHTSSEITYLTEKLSLSSKLAELYFASGDLLRILSENGWIAFNDKYSS